jgi:hypothetical protein
MRESLSSRIVKEPMRHLLKTWPDSFLDLLLGHKSYVVLPDDRAFSLGDVLVLQEWAPREPHPEAHLGTGGYTGRVIEALVVHKTEGGQSGLPDGLCVLGVETVLRRLGQ